MHWLAAALGESDWSSSQQYLETSGIGHGTFSVPCKALQTYNDLIYMTYTARDLHTKTHAYFHTDKVVCVCMNEKNIQRRG